MKEQLVLMIPNGKLAVLTRSVIEKSCVKYITGSDEGRKTNCAVLPGLLIVVMRFSA